MLILGIETSCDETAAAVVEDGGRVLSNVVRSQIDLHEPFGGVVPEIACRAHVDVITAVIDRALTEAGVSLAEIGGVAATARPGLIGALLVGLTAGKAIALARGLPLAGVDHVQAHVYSARMAPDPPAYPYVCLVASGGHTVVFRAESPLATAALGATTDDAAGEAFDKAAVLLGLSYPGGPRLAALAATGNRTAIRFPRAFLTDPRIRFSFSGVKTAVLYHLRGQDGAGGGAAPAAAARREDVAASFQEAVVDALVVKTLQAAAQQGIPRVAVTGGVSASLRLRERFEEEARRARVAGQAVRVHFPPRALTTDNGAMIAGLGYHLLAAGQTAPLSLPAVPS
ncbi:MAG: tRNA (adenosine(37)-N6)-threonylcarbamoyltransferase complex transferase subunit TsaD [Planctomycetes bacterium]|nr:tRNA (adenosine(37)-N6)-threonylcarbamoyltransferase complex transferase subunit TsaD [Planctomycetota bacterium]